MRRLAWFALPFGAGCAACCYLLPENGRLWAAAGAVLTALCAAVLGGRAKRRIRIAALGCAAGILWFAGYAGLYLSPAETLVGGKYVLEMEL